MENVPYLSGGIFFLLLVEAKATSRPRRDSLDGVKDSVSQKNMLAGLIQQFDSGFRPPMQGRTFDTDQSAYRSCEKDALPFFDQQLADTYDRKVRDDFDAALSRMEDYARYYLNTESQEKMDWLGYALIDTLQKDGLIQADQILYYQPGGITKSKLLTLEHVYIPSLLLALWHFILTRRPGNRAGRATFEAWNVQQGEKGNRWTFHSDIGLDYPIKIKFDFDKGEPAAEEVHEEEPVVEEIPRIEVHPYVDPRTGQQVLAQFKVEAHDNGIAIGQVFGGLVIGGKRGKDE